MIPAKEELQKLYNSGSSLNQLAKQFNVSGPTIRSWLLKYNIPLRTHKEASNNKHQIGIKRIDANIIRSLDNVEWLSEQRVILQKSAETIAKELGCSTDPVLKALKKHNLWDVVDARRRNNNANKCLNSYEWLFDHYINKDLTMPQIAEILSSSTATIQRWITFHNIPPKNPNSYPKNNPRISKEENSLLESIREFYDGEILTNQNTLCKPYELDLVIPEKNIAIEYNGLYSHIYRPWESSPGKIKDKNYHLNKTIKCEENGYQLLHFYSDEWLLQKDIVKSIIKSKLGLTQKIYARECVFSHIDINDKNNFLRQNHIQGEDRSLIKLGLHYKGQLVAVMTFAKPRFTKVDWELTRYACLSGYTVVGGFSKLFKNAPISGTIISYADRRISNGNVYFKNGFNLIRTNSPSYYWVNAKNYNERLHRMHIQKDPNLNGTEYEQARNKGYEKIWDCGTLAFLINKNI